MSYRNLIKKADSIVDFHKNVSTELKKCYSFLNKLNSKTNIRERYELKSDFTSEMNLFINSTDNISSMKVNQMILFSNQLYYKHITESETNIDEEYYILKYNEPVKIMYNRLVRPSKNVNIGTYGELDIKKNIGSDELFQMQLIHHEEEILAYLVLCKLHALDHKIIPNQYVFNIIIDDELREYLQSKCIEVLKDFSRNWR